VPSEYSSGASTRRGGLTKAGNSAARRLLIEAAWCYTNSRNFLDLSVFVLPVADRLRRRLGGCPGDRAEGADQAGICGKAVPGRLTGVQNVGQVAEYRVGEPMAAQIVPDALDRI
jgi:hypothetical protein